LVFFSVCLIVSVDTKILELVPLEGETLPVRSLLLKGSPKTTLELLQIRGITGPLEQQQQLCSRYSNNPLAIQLVAATIRRLIIYWVATAVRSTVRAPFAAPGINHGLVSH